MRRNEVWWADLPPPIGSRPVVLISRDKAYRVRTMVTVVPLTSRIRNLPTEVLLGPEDGIGRPSVANCDSIATVARAGLKRRIVSLTSDKVAEIDKALRFALDLGN